MHVTSDSPLTDRAAVMLANGVLYAGQDRPDPAAPPASFDTHTGPWTPTADEWAQVCRLVDRIVDEAEVSVLVAMVARLAARPGGVPAALSDLVLLDTWAHAAPAHRTAVLLSLAWQARDAAPATDRDEVPDRDREVSARALQHIAHGYAARTGGADSWFGAQGFPAVLPDHDGADMARRIVDRTDEAGTAVASLHIALMLSETAQAHREGTR